MTYFPEPKTDNLDNFKPIGSLLRLINVYQTCADNMMGLRGIVRVMKNLARYERDLAKARAHNVRVALKSIMLQIPKWREKVLADLGGQAALVRWCQRFDKMCESKTVAKTPLSKMRINQDCAASRSGKKSPAVKTDADGLFRLAAIVVPKDRDNKTSKTSERTLARARPFAPPFKPIPLLPEELRGLAMAPYPVPPEIPNYRKFADDLIAAPEDTDELVEGDDESLSSLRPAARPINGEKKPLRIPMQNPLRQNPRPEPAWHPANSLVPD